MKTNGMRTYSALAVVVVLLLSLARRGLPTAPFRPLQSPEETRASELVFPAVADIAWSDVLGLLSGPTDASARVQETQQGQVLSDANTGQVNTE